MQCAHCGQRFDERQVAACPHCQFPVRAGQMPVVPLQGQSAPNARVALTGEVIEEAPTHSATAPLPNPGMQPQRPPVSLPQAVPPGNPARPNAPYRLTPRAEETVSADVLAAEKKVIRALKVAGALLAGLAVFGGFLLYNHLKESQAHFERQSHLHLSTPKEAAQEILYSLKEDAPARL